VLGAGKAGNASGMEDADVDEDEGKNDHGYGGDQATTLKVRVFTMSPIKSRRFTNKRMKTRTTGSQTPFPTCERTRIYFGSGARGNQNDGSATTIIPV